MRGRDDDLRPEFFIRVRAWGQRQRDDERAGRQLPGRGEDRADQGFWPADDGGGPGDERKQQYPRPQLPGQVLQLADVPPGERPPGRQREHRGSGHLLPDVGGKPAHLPERAVLRRPQGR
jgi:hypothetical protein